MWGIPWYVWKTYLKNSPKKDLLSTKCWRYSVVSMTKDELKAALRKYSQELGRRGGKRAAKNMTPEARTLRARNAANARYNKRAKEASQEK